MGLSGIGLLGLTGFLNLVLHGSVCAEFVVVLVGMNGYFNILGSCSAAEFSANWILDTQPLQTTMHNCVIFTIYHVK